MKVAHTDGPLSPIGFFYRHHHIEAALTAANRLGDRLEVRAKIDVIRRFGRKRILHGSEPTLPFVIRYTSLSVMSSTTTTTRCRRALLSRDHSISTLRLDCPLSCRHEIKGFSSSDTGLGRAMSTTHQVGHGMSPVFQHNNNSFLMLSFHLSHRREDRHGVHPNSRFPAVM